MAIVVIHRTDEHIRKAIAIRVAEAGNAEPQQRLDLVRFELSIETRVEHSGASKIDEGGAFIGLAIIGKRRSRSP